MIICYEAWYKIRSYSQLKAKNSTDNEPLISNVQISMYNAWWERKLVLKYWSIWVDFSTPQKYEPFEILYLSWKPRDVLLVLVAVKNVVV